MAQHQGVFALCQRIKKVARNKNHTKQQHGFINQRRQAPGTGRAEKAIIKLSFHEQDFNVCKPQHQGVQAD